MSSLYGIDEAALTYHQEECDNFEMEDGQFLTGDKLISHLRRCNKTLADKVKLYQQKLENNEN